MTRLVVGDVAGSAVGTGVQHDPPNKPVPSRSGRATGRKNVRGRELPTNPASNSMENVGVSGGKLTQGLESKMISAVVLQEPKGDREVGLCQGTSTTTGSSIADEADADSCGPAPGDSVENTSTEEQEKRRNFKWKDPRVFKAMILAMLKMEYNATLLDTTACKVAFESEMTQFGGVPGNISLDSFRRALFRVQDVALQISEIRSTMTVTLARCKTDTERQRLLVSAQWRIDLERIRDLMTRDVYYKTATHDPHLEDQIVAFAEKLYSAKEAKVWLSRSKQIAQEKKQDQGGILLDCATTGGSARKARELYQSTRSSDADSDSGKSEEEEQHVDDDEANDSDQEQRPVKRDRRTKLSEAEEQLDDEEAQESDQKTQKRKKSIYYRRGNISDQPMDRAKRLSLERGASDSGLDLGSAQKKMENSILLSFLPDPQMNSKLEKIDKALLELHRKMESIFKFIEQIESKETKTKEDA